MFHPEGPSLAELAVQALSSTRRGYDRLAPKFDRTPFRTPDVVIDAAAAHVGEVDRLVDLCCGTGAAMARLRRRCREEIVGVDFSRGMLDVAAERLVAAPGAARVELVQADVLELGASLEGRFDVATCFGAFGHILRQDEPRFVAGVRRVLAPGGRFVFVTAHAPPPTDPRWWLAHGFNTAMRVRNALVRPAFVMIYLTFVLPGCAALLERAGFEVGILDPSLPAPLSALRVVVARKPR